LSDWSVAGFVIVTSASATAAPEESRTTPSSAPVVADWPQAALQAQTSATTNAAALKEEKIGFKSSSCPAGSRAVDRYTLTGPETPG
jgi:hypothetical protein